MFADCRAGVIDALQTEPCVPTHKNARHGTGLGAPRIGVVGLMHASDLGDSGPSQSPTGELRRRGGTTIERCSTGARPPLFLAYGQFLNSPR